MASADVTFQLGKQQSADLKALMDTEASVLVQLKQAIENSPDVPLTLDALSECFDKTLNNSSSAGSAFRVVVGLTQLIRQTHVDVDDLVQNLPESMLSTDPDENTKTREAWSAIADSLKSLLQCEKIHVAIKAQGLAYDYANLYRSAKIMTDIRPVFDASAEQIFGSIVSFTLRLDFDSRDGDHNLSVAMDQGDVKKLMEECERALRKAQTAKSYVLDHEHIIIAGDKA